MLLLGIDLGTSSIKVSVIDAVHGNCIASAQYPETETPILALQTGWAEQSPELWWEHVQKAIGIVNASGKFNPTAIKAIGIAYQMHGLVLVDKEKKVLRPSIIWCDSRAVSIGEKSLQQIGEEKCLSHLLNYPGNFTASKLAWVKDNEPQVYDKIDKVMLPGDFIAMKLTGGITTTIAALSEGVFWDFKNNILSEDVFDCYGLDKAFIPEIKPVFSSHGGVKEDVAATLGLKAGIQVCYKAGDQPNNALSLNVMQPGEVAATAGTSGVIYAVNDTLTYDKQSRVNSFAHVNHSDTNKRIGVLLCINGCGIMNRYVKDNFANGLSYQQMNEAASKINPGSDGLQVLPFGNGAERMLNNKIVTASFSRLDLNKHTPAHLFRATQEGIAFAFRFGLDIMRENDVHPTIIRAGKSNLFLSEVFVKTFVNVTGVPVELYNCDGSVGAAIGAAIGIGYYKDSKEAFTNFKPLSRIEPEDQNLYEGLYQEWKANLLSVIK
jgi:xylulokinase